jgi:uncharacterized protein
VKENLYTPDCIRTFTGKYVNVIEPTADTICIEDIAHGLSQQCRFGGQLPKFYSVAEHSLRCAGLAEQQNKLEALLHDASEAYLLDIPSPIKKHLTNYKEIEQKLMLVIAQKFGFTYPMSKEVEKIDVLMLQWEWEWVMLQNSKQHVHEPMSMGYAKASFLAEFHKITHP